MDYWPTDSWRNSKPEQQGVNASYIEDLDSYLLNNMKNLRGTIIVKNGYIVYEKYMNGYEASDEHDTWSVTKSVISALVGVAIRNKCIENVDQSLSKFFSDSLVKGNSSLQTVTIKNLLQMTSGYGWNLGGTNFWLKKLNWVKAALNDEILYKPGEVFQYSNQSAHILSALLTKVTGMDTVEFAQKYLFNPLGITNFKWELDPQGIAFGGAGLSLRPRDMAKFGYLYLRYGFWNGQQIVPKQWIEDSTLNYVSGAEPENEKYGYMWWVKDDRHKAYFASGYGGQYIYIIPQLDTVIVTVSSSYTGHRENRIIIDRYIVPSIENM